jgi:molecular chaperone GrpE
MTEKDETEMMDKRPAEATTKVEMRQSYRRRDAEHLSELAEAARRPRPLQELAAVGGRFHQFQARVEQERSEGARLASAAMVINILPVYDDLDRAVSNVDAGLAGLNWVQGVVAIHQKFGRLLEAMNVREVEAEGKDFDPSQHEAIGRQPGPEGKVLQVIQKGYMGTGDPPAW